MSQGDVEVVRAGFEAWGRGEPEAMLELLDPAIEWTVRPDLPDAGVYRGHQGVIELLSRFGEVLEDQWFDPQDYIDAGEGVVVVPLRWGGRGRSSGIDMAEGRETWVFTVENGKVTRVTEYSNKAEALEAVGLSE
jgi:ketosteroid isomerase-like protein